MKRKLLVIAGLLGICLVGTGANRLVLAAEFCSGTYCAANPDSFCTCPPGTQVYEKVGTDPSAAVPCNNYTWHADCNYL